MRRRTHEVKGYYSNRPIALAFHTWHIGITSAKIEVEAAQNRNGICLIELIDVVTHEKTTFYGKGCGNAKNSH